LKLDYLFGFQNFYRIPQSDKMLLSYRVIEYKPLVWLSFTFIFVTPVKRKYSSQTLRLSGDRWRRYCASGHDNSRRRPRVPWTDAGVKHCA